MSIIKELSLLGNTDNIDIFKHEGLLKHKIKNDFLSKWVGSSDLFIESFTKKGKSRICGIFIKDLELYKWLDIKCKNAEEILSMFSSWHPLGELDFYPTEVEDILSYFYKSDEIGDHFKVILDSLGAKDELKAWISFNFTNRFVFALRCKNNLKMFNAECLSLDVLFDTFFFPDIKTD